MADCLAGAHTFRLVMDLKRARQEGWHFGAKMVRGAYMVIERERAAKEGYPSPIHDTIEDTHLNYNRCGCPLTPHKDSTPLVAAPRPISALSLPVVAMHQCRGCQCRGCKQSKQQR